MTLVYIEYLFIGVYSFFIIFWIPAFAGMTNESALIFLLLVTTTVRLGFPPLHMERGVGG